MAQRRGSAARSNNATVPVEDRLSHYYRISRGLEQQSVDSFVDRSVQWHQSLVDKRPATRRYRYDVAISFAGEQRDHAERLARALRVQNVRLFYDGFEQAELWGANLFERLYEVYSKEARYCIVFVSRDYKEKMWTVHERRAAQERVLQEREREYLLPIRVDATQLPGMPGTVAYVDLERTTIDEIADLFIQKLGIARSTRT